jgi:predicted MFS family arabinose efflux permease
VQAVILGLLTLSGLIEVWHVLVLSALLGLIHSLEMPSRHSFLSDIVTREDLPNAIALNSSAFNIARFAGPFMAGVLIASVGEGPVFLLNALSFFAVIYNLNNMRLPSYTPVKADGSTFNKMREGLSFAWKNKPIRSSLMFLSIFSIVGTSMTVLMPVFTTKTFHGGSEVLGFLLGSMGIGALAGALTLAYRSSHEHLQWQIGGAGVVAGLCLIMFPLTTRVILAVPILAVFGYCQTILAASTNTLIQSRVTDALRGRVMSVFSTVFIGFMPIGSLTSGLIADKIGVIYTVYILGIISVLAASVFLLHNRSWTIEQSNGKAT